jgi:hypothetical protein
MRGSCVTPDIAKQSANGSVIPVNVAGTPNTENVIMTADGPRPLIDPLKACAVAGSGLLWYNPGTG